MAEAVRRRVEVPPELAGERIDRVAACLFDDFSRGQLAQWIRAGSLTLDGAAVRPKTRVIGGEVVVLEAEAPEILEDQPQDVEFKVIYEDEEVLVVDKPAGLVVHPGAGNPDATLVNGLLLHRPALAALPRAGIVHRLDKDTTGLLVVAATSAARARLIEDLAARVVGRHYLAVVEGEVTGGRLIDAAVGRDRHRPTRQQVRADGKAARTRFRVTERFRAHSAVVASLETGRTHQIRVHMSHIGHPLVGDRLYGARGRLPPQPSETVVGVLRAFPRQALHAQSLEFSHPGSARSMRFESPLPVDLARLLEVLREDRDDVA